MILRIVEGFNRSSIGQSHLIIAKQNIEKEITSQKKKWKQKKMKKPEERSSGEDSGEREMEGEKLRGRKKWP